MSMILRCWAKYITRCCSSFKMSHTRLNRTVTWMMGLQKETRCDGALVDESQGTDAVGGIFTGEGQADHQGQGVGAARAELPPDAAGVPALRQTRGGGAGARSARQGLQPGP